MNLFVAYLLSLKGVVFSPSKTFKSVIAAKENKKYLLLIIPCIVILDFISPSFFQGDFKSTHSYVGDISKLSFLITLFLFFGRTYLTHLLVRSYSAGKLIWLIILDGLALVVLDLLHLVQDWLVLPVLEALILQIIVTVWSIYLSVIAISVLYKVSRLEAFFVTISASILFLIISFLLIIILRSVF